MQIPDESIEDTYTFDALGLDPLDLMFVVLRLERFDLGNGDFPVAALDRARTVGDLVVLVDDWLHRVAKRLPKANDPAKGANARQGSHR